MKTQEFIKYLEKKDFAPTTQKGLLFRVQMFFKWAKVYNERSRIIEAEQVTKPDVLRYLEYLKNRKGYQNTSRSHVLVALNHYFTFLQKSGQIDKNPCNFLKIRGTQGKKLYKLYTCEELDTLFDNFYHFFVRNFDDSKIPKSTRNQVILSRERNAVVLSVLLNQGVITGEIERIKTSDLDLTKAILKIRGGILGNERILPLKAAQIGLFINYLQNIRPQFIEYQAKESDKLFLSLHESSNKKTNGGTLKSAFTILSKQLKSIDKQFINFKQVRASLITFWLKTYGLRKAQHFAGHRSVSTTERYKPNNLDALTDDINKMNPF
jgi:site-specific recombinase XerD